MRSEDVVAARDLAWSLASELGACNEAAEIVETLRRSSPALAEVLDCTKFAASREFRSAAAACGYADAIERLHRQLGRAQAMLRSERARLLRETGAVQGTLRWAEAAFAESASISAETVATSSAVAR